MGKIAAALVLILLLLPIPSQAKELLFVTLDNTPQAYYENGEVTGFLTEIVTEAARRAGYDAKVKIVPWQRALAMTKKGLADAVFNAGFNKQREMYLRYPKPVLMTEKIVAMRKAGSKVFLNFDLSEAEQLTVGVGRGFFYGDRIQKAINQNIFLRVEEVPNIDLNIKKLLLGRIDIFFGDYYPVIKYLNEQGLLDKVEAILDPSTGLPMIYSKSDTFLAFSKKKSEVPFKKVNAELEKMIEDGTYRSIVIKYIPVHDGF